MEEDQIVDDVAVETTPANTVVTPVVETPVTTNASGIRSQRVTSRNFTNNGDILITLADGRKIILNKEQVGMLLMIGESVPKIGATILIEDSINPTTGEVSGTWAKLSL